MIAFAVNAPEHKVIWLRGAGISQAKHPPHTGQQLSLKISPEGHWPRSTAGTAVPVLGTACATCAHTQAEQGSASHCSQILAQHAMKGLQHCQCAEFSREGSWGDGIPTDKNRKF